MLKLWHLLAIAGSALTALLFSFLTGVIVDCEIRHDTYQSGIRDCPSLLPDGLWWIYRNAESIGVIATVISTIFIAIYTAILAGSTKRLWEETKRLAQGAEEQARLTRIEFISTHRPKLHIRRIILRKIQFDAPITVQYSVVNIGDTEAEITFHEFRVRVGSAEKDIAHGIPQNDLAIGQKIAPGKDFLFSRETNLRAAKGWDAPDWPIGNLFAIGHIKYKDGNGTIRQIEFERVYRDDMKRFGPIEPRDEDYDYED